MHNFIFAMLTLWLSINACIVISMYAFHAIGFIRAESNSRLVVLKLSVINLFAVFLLMVATTMHKASKEYEQELKAKTQIEES